MTVVRYLKKGLAHRALSDKKRHRQLVKLNVLSGLSEFTNRMPELCHLYITYLQYNLVIANLESLPHTIWEVLLSPVIPILYQQILCERSNTCTAMVGQDQDICRHTCEYTGLTIQFTIGLIGSRYLEYSSEIPFFQRLQAIVRQNSYWERDDKHKEKMYMKDK